MHARHPTDEHKGRHDKTDRYRTHRASSADPAYTSHRPAAGPLQLLAWSSGRAKSVKKPALDSGLFATGDARNPRDRRPRELGRRRGP